MSDLYGGQFNSGDFYGLGDDDVSNADLTWKQISDQAFSQPAYADSPVSSQELDQMATNAPLVYMRMNQPPVHAPPVVYDQIPDIFDDLSNGVVRQTKKLVDILDPTPSRNSTSVADDFKKAFGIDITPEPASNFKALASPVKPGATTRAMDWLLGPSTPAPVATPRSASQSLPSPSWWDSLGLTSSPPAAKSAATANRTAPKSGGSGQPSTFAQDVNSVVTGITSLFAPFVAARQQRAAGRQAQGQRNPRGGAGGKSGDDTTTYLYIGGGALLLAGLVYMVAKD